MESIESPFLPPKITDEIMKSLQQTTKAKSVFLVISDETTKDHVCDPATCTGHYMNWKSLGFGMPQLLGILSSIAEEHGYHLVPNDE